MSVGRLIYFIREPFTTGDLSSSTDEGSLGYFLAAAASYSLVASTYAGVAMRYSLTAASYRFLSTLLPLVVAHF